MACGEITYFSSALQKQTSAGIIVPEPGAEAPFAVLYLLHGLSDDHSAWMRWTSIERYVSELPIIVVAPDGYRGFYANSVDGPAVETAIARELPDYVDGLFHTRRERAGRCVAGLSMGGYGALKFAFKYPGRFCAAVSHSGAMNMGHLPLAGLECELQRAFGQSQTRPDDDLYRLAEGVDHAGLPALRIECGTSDLLIEPNRDFHNHLIGLGIPHEYQEHDGGHDWSVWDFRVRETVAFCARALGLR